MQSQADVSLKSLNNTANFNVDNENNVTISNMAGDNEDPNY